MYVILETYDCTQLLNKRTSQLFPSLIIDRRTVELSRRGTQSALVIPKFTISYFSLTNQKEQKRGLRFF